MRVPCHEDEAGAGTLTGGGTTVTDHVPGQVLMPLEMR